MALAISAMPATAQPAAPRLRVPAAVAVGGAILVTASLARRLGGGPYAQALAPLCTATSAMALVMGSFYSMNAFELLFWPGMALALVVAAQGDPRRGWLAAGVLLGLALENKHTTMLPAGAFAIGVLATPLRSQLRTRWPWIAMAVAVLLLLPNVLWQAAHGFPSLEFYRNAQASKNVPTQRIERAGTSWSPMCPPPMNRSRRPNAMGRSSCAAATAAPVQSSSWGLRPACRARSPVTRATGCGVPESRPLRSSSRSGSTKKPWTKSFRPTSSPACTAASTAWSRAASRADVVGRFDAGHPRLSASPSQQ